MAEYINELTLILQTSTKRIGVMGKAYSCAGECFVDFGGYVLTVDPKLGEHHSDVFVVVQNCVILEIYTMIGAETKVYQMHFRFGDALLTTSGREVLTIPGIRDGLHNIRIPDITIGTCETLLLKNTPQYVVEDIIPRTFSDNSANGAADKQPQEDNSYSGTIAKLLQEDNFAYLGLIAKYKMNPGKGLCFVCDGGLTIEAHNLKTVADFLPSFGGTYGIAIQKGKLVQIFPLDKDMEEMTLVFNKDGKAAVSATEDVIVSGITEGTYTVSIPAGMFQFADTVVLPSAKPATKSKRSLYEELADEIIACAPPALVMGDDKVEAALRLAIAYMKG